MSRWLAILILCMSLPAVWRLTDYAGPPWKIEIGAPSYANPVYVLRQDKEPRRIAGYKWFRTDLSNLHWSRDIAEDYGWALHRMHDAPPNDDHLFPRPKN